MKPKHDRDTRADEGPSPLGAWARALVGFVLVVGITEWPYAYACGFPLLGYLTAVTMVFVTGVWAAQATWQARTAAAHLVSLVVLLAGVLLATVQVLPRIEAAHADVTWRCTR